MPPSVAVGGALLLAGLGLGLVLALRSRAGWRARALQGEPAPSAPPALTAELLVVREAAAERSFLATVIELAPEGLMVLDAQGAVTSVNGALRAMLSLDCTPEGDLEALVGAARPPWLQRLFAEGTLPFEQVLFLGGPDGARTLSVSGAVIRGPAGEVEAAVLVCRDTARMVELALKLQAAHQRLAESERFFHDLFEAIDDPITVLSPEGEILQANRAARAFFGAHIVGRRCHRAFRMRESPCEACPAAETVARRATVSVEHRVFGNTVTRISTYPLIGKNGEVQAVINHKRDVTQERQLDDLKAGFLAAVSHELRTPLTSIMGFNKLNIRRLARQVEPAIEATPHAVRVAFAKVLEDMSVMDSECERLGRLVNDVLDLSKLDAGKLTLDMTDVEVAPLVQGALVATSALWHPKMLSVSAEVPAGLPRVFADADRVSQILVNLVSNAAKFTQEGSVRVVATATEQVVRVEVIDTGRGIPPLEIAHVFERFRQVAGSGIKGTGLGLPICRELIRLHGGEIDVRSREGEGSTFSFTLPRADALGAAERQVRRNASISRL